MSAMIVTPQPLATQEGAKVLMRGSNTVDAAVTCALVQSIVSPHACSIGGYVIANLYMSGQQGSIGLDAPAPAGAKVTETMWVEPRRVCARGDDLHRTGDKCSVWRDRHWHGWNGIFG